MRPRSSIAAHACLLVLLAVSGEAKAFGLFSVREPVFALIDGVLLAGEAIGRWDRTGTVALRSTQDDSLRCTGTFKYKTLKRGAARIHCTDGSAVELEFSALGALSGWGEGPTPHGPVRFTFGLALDAATPYLKVPDGKRIVLTPQGARLQDR